MSLDLNTEDKDKPSSGMGRYYSSILDEVTQQINSRDGGLLLEEDQFKGFGWDPDKFNDPLLL